MYLRIAALGLVASMATATVTAQETLARPMPDAERVVAPPPPTPVVNTPPAPPAVPGPARPAFRLGLGGAYSLALHSADKLVLPDVPSCCTGYSSTSGSGISAGLEGALPVSNDVDLILRLQYQTASADMQALEPTTVRSGNTTRETNLAHDLTSSLGFLFVEPAIEYRPGGGTALGLVGGIRLGTLMSATYTQQESFADPALPFEFRGGGTLRNATSGDIPQTNAMQFGLLAGARYHLSLADGGVLQLVPEIVFSPMFTDIVQGQSWSVSSLRAGITVVYSFMHTVTEASPLRPRN